MPENPQSDSSNDDLDNTPCIIEIEINENAPPEMSNMLFDFLDPNNADKHLDLAVLKILLQQPSLQSAEPPFRYFWEQTDEVLASLQQSEAEKKERARFLTLHFSDSEKCDQILKELKQLPYIECAAPVPCFDSTDKTDFVGLTEECSSIEEITEKQWYLEKCSIDQAWKKMKVSGRDVVISDIDWGFRKTHNDLRKRITKTVNAIDGSRNVYSDDTSINHGTAVMGQVGAADDSKGIKGIAFRSELWAIKAIVIFEKPPTNQCRYWPWLKAIDIVRGMDSKDKRKVLLFEIQGVGKTNIEGVPSVSYAIRKAIQDNIVSVIPAGNGGISADVPCRTGSILVGATTINDERWEGSNHGCTVVVCAPGDPAHDLTCCGDGDDKYRLDFGGTSGAAAKVAGVVALILEANPHLTHQQVRKILLDTGTALPTDKPIGKLINAYAAVQKAKTYIPLSTA